MRLVLSLLGPLAIVALVFLFILIKSFGLWREAHVSGAGVGFGRLVGMWIRRVNARTVVDSRIMLMKAGLPVDTNLLETHFLTGGDVVKVSLAMIAASNAGIELPFQRAAAIDLAGRDVLDAVKAGVNSKMINPISEPAESISERR